MWNHGIWNNGKRRFIFRHANEGESTQIPPFFTPFSFFWGGGGFVFAKNNHVKGKATAAMRSAVVSEQDCRLLGCQNPFIYSNPSPVGAAPTRARAHALAHGKANSNKKAISGGNKGRDVSGAPALERRIGHTVVHV